LAGAVTACSLRDILVSRRADQRAHDERACALANAHLDAVLVHCDPGFARLEDTFAARARLAVPVHYTGFAVADRDAPPSARQRVVVSAGGGLVGEPLLRAAALAQPGTGVPMRLIAGPLLPADAFERLGALAGPGVELRRTVQDLGAELRSARASVSQGGYNTALEVVRSGVPALLVPYETPEEDEQVRRAARLERLGAVRVLRAARLDELAAELPRLLRFTPARAPLALDGAARSAALLAELLELAPAARTGSA
jgi:predicted glycosyltransferase